jgi:hypothetical protein
MHPRPHLHAYRAILLPLNGEVPGWRGPGLRLVAHELVSMSVRLAGSRLSRQIGVEIPSGTELDQDGSIDLTKGMPHLDLIVAGVEDEPGRVLSVGR